MTTKTEVKTPKVEMTDLADAMRGADLKSIEDPHKRKLAMFSAMIKVCANSLPEKEAGELRASWAKALLPAVQADDGPKSDREADFVDKVVSDRILNPATGKIFGQR